jgi:hypothetical protein
MQKAVPFFRVGAVFADVENKILVAVPLSSLDGPCRHATEAGTKEGGQ